MLRRIVLQNASCGGSLASGRRSTDNQAAPRLFTPSDEDRAAIGQMAAHIDKGLIVMR